MKNNNTFKIMPYEKFIEEGGIISNKFIDITIKNNLILFNDKSLEEQKKNSLLIIDDIILSF